MTATLIATLASAPVITAVVAILRRVFGREKLDGWIIPVVAGVLAVASAVLGYYAAAIPPIVWVVLGPIVTTVLAVGGMQAAQDVAAKAKGAAVTWVEAPKAAPDTIPAPRPDVEP